MNEFTNVKAEEVAQWYRIDVEQLKGAKILFAYYEYEDYSGSSFVLYKKGRKLYEVHGSHCSCYGLEDQWSPEETSRKELLHRLNNGTYWQRYKDELLAVLQVKRKARNPSTV